MTPFVPDEPMTESSADRRHCTAFDGHWDLVAIQDSGLCDSSRIVSSHGVESAMIWVVIVVSRSRLSVVDRMMVAWGNRRRSPMKGLDWRF